MPSYTVLCPFLNPDPSYALGVELGLLYETLKALPPGSCHTSFYSLANQEQICLLASRLGLRILKMKPSRRAPSWFLLKIQKPLP